MRAADIGTSRVVQLNESSTICEAARTMRQHDVGCVVTMKNTLAGMLPSGVVTDRDLTIRFLANDIGQEKTLRDIQSTPLVTCHADTTIDEIIGMMLGSDVRRMPIVDDQDQLIGIVSLDDVMAALAELMQRVSCALTGSRELD
ncbi:CBS domain-containing protein [Rhodanobacter sp. B04]|uniref:CBS domain-containing protein n=1 Tax=Rhodanobacter sp. B04 TaxID=1945860 RepID=UPI00143B7283|nr:CBS domain-containing protein [Rhodanobacter sp. B04]